MAGTKDDTAVTWPTMACAVALLARQQLCPDVSRAVLLEGCEPGGVLAAMEIIAAVLTGIMFADQGGRFLELLGLAALEHGAKQAGGPE